jgi:hypothetical protein
MSLFRRLGLILFCFTFQVNCSHARAEESSPNLLTLAYFSWTEPVSFAGGGQNDTGTALVFGNSLSFERVLLRHERFELTANVSALLGVANAGGTQTNLSYHLSAQPWWGIGLGAQAGYKVASEITASIGVTGLWRHLELPTDPTGISASMGPSFQPLINSSLRLKVFGDFDIQEELGFLLASQSTYWALGAGFAF